MAELKGETGHFVAADKNSTVMRLVCNLKHGMK